MQTARLVLPVVGAMFFALSAGPGEARDHIDRIEDLRQRAAEVRSIDPTDEDYSDLKPLAEAIGDARVVQLGESTHGSGATFAAKVRLIKFLHQELGFDVLVWESGMYDVRAVNDALRAASDLLAAARLGIFGIWAGSQEVAPLFEYARDSHTTDRPLEMVGLDVQFSGRDIDDFEVDLLDFIAKVERTSVRERAISLARDVVDGYRGFIAVHTARSEYLRELREDGATNDEIRDSLKVWHKTAQQRLAPKHPDLERFLFAADLLLELLVSQRSEFTSIHGEHEVAFIERVTGNLREYGITQYERNFADRPVEGDEALALRNRGWNRRDERMADNMEWLASTRYPDRKLIVWAHNGHIMNAHYHPDWNTLSHAAVEGGMKPMGAFIAESMGEAVYTIGFTAFAGEYRPMQGPLDSLKPVESSEDSLEALLHNLGHDFVFLDFRKLPRDHWLRQPSTMAIRAYMSEQMEDWTRVVDGVFFIDRMTPSTSIEWQ